MLVAPGLALLPGARPDLGRGDLAGIRPRWCKHTLPPAAYMDAGPQIQARLVNNRRQGTP